jgi:hypothetical protein
MCIIHLLGFCEPPTQGRGASAEVIALLPMNKAKARSPNDIVKRKEKKKPRVATNVIVREEVQREAW